jgi:hypothetical protein
MEWIWLIQQSPTAGDLSGLIIQDILLSAEYTFFKEKSTFIFIFLQLKQKILKRLGL